MNKGERRRRAVLDQAMDLSSEIGLEGLSFGVLAKRAGMSKSGLYAHFETKEDLQCQVLDAGAQLFIDRVMVPALKEPRGLPRLDRLFERWLNWAREGLSGGCLFMAASTEFDDRPGPVRDQLASHLRDMLGAISRAARIAVEEGHFRADLDVDQVAYSLWGILLAYQNYSRLLDREDAADRARMAYAALVERSRARQE